MDEPSKPRLKGVVTWCMLAVGIALLLGGLLPWAGSVDLISEDEKIRSLSWTALVGGVVMLLLALVSRAPRTTGCFTLVVGILCGSFVILALLAAFWGPPLGAGIFFAFLGSMGAFALGLVILVTVVGSGEEVLRANSAANDD